MEPRPVFVAQGDRLAELESLVRDLGGEERAGLHRRMYVTRAGQTVAIVTDLNSPLAAALRARDGWLEPTEP